MISLCFYVIICGFFGVSAEFGSIIENCDNSVCENIKRYDIVGIDGVCFNEPIITFNTSQGTSIIRGLTKENMATKMITLCDFNVDVSKKQNNSLKTKMTKEPFLDLDKLDKPRKKIF